MNRDGTRLDRRWVLVCTALAALLRLFRVGHQSLWIDEMISLGLANYAHGAPFWTGLIHDIHGPFNSALLHVWGALGSSEAWLRLLYVIPSVAAVPVMAALAANLFGRRAGHAAALAAAVSPFLVWYAQEVRSYAWALLWISITLLLFVRAWDGRSGRGTWIALAGTAALGILTNYSYAFLLIALTVAAALRRPFSARFLVAWAAVVAVAGLVFLPWFVDWYQRIGQGRLLTAAPAPLGVPLREAEGVSPLDVGYLAWTFAYGYSLGPSLRALHLDRSLAALAPHAPVLVVGGAAVAVGAWLGLREMRRRGRTALVVTVGAVPLGLALVLALREVKTFHPRYLIVCLPVFLAVLAAGWTASRRVGRIAGGVALVLAGVSLGHHYFDPVYAKEDSRAAAALIREKEQPGDSVVVIYSYRPFRHYFSDTADGAARLLHLHKRFLQTDDQMRAHVRDARTGAGRVWLVLSRWWDVAPEERIRRIFEESLQEAGRWEFAGVKVTLYEGEPT
jgi:4-amino-4-deoxy-L-arabinose transferase-like glycosyltransferase